MSIKPCIECGYATEFKLSPRFVEHGRTVHFCQDCRVRLIAHFTELGMDWAFLRGYNHLINRGCTIRRPLVVDTALGRINHR